MFISTSIFNWCQMETGWYSSEGSEMGFSPTLSDGYWESFCSIDNGLPLHCKENGGANSMNLEANQDQMHLYQMNMQMDNIQFAEEEEEDLSLSSKKSSFSTVATPKCCYPSFDLDPSQAQLITCINSSLAPPHYNITTMRTYNQNLNPKFSALEREVDADAAIMRAMVAVISSTSSSSSSSSSPSVLSNQPSQAQPRGNRKFGAFRRYSRSDHLAAKFEAEDSYNHGQNMMKRSILMLKRLSSFEGRSQETRSTCNQMHHVISERRRREKLNASFEALRMQLPPGTKKDKTSVLSNTRNYVNKLQSQISELEEKNRKLETCLNITDEGKEEACHGLNGKVQVQLIKSSSPPTTTELQQINLRITLRVECDIIELVLHILECLKVIRAINLISVDAYTYSPQMNLFAKASIKFGIKDCDWDEALFHDAMSRAVDDATLNTVSIFSELNHLF